ncbi:hypothetical protein Leryth_003065 [Lithospermum erythrorhizon]|nr:hypothetical protein Leryth_003065 [Lithospermum erythrorhizon]
MALARLVLKNLQQRVVSPSSSAMSQNVCQRGLNNFQNKKCSSELLRRFATAANEEKSQGKEISVSEGGKKYKPFPRRRRRNLWRRNTTDFAPSIWEFLPSGLGNALLQATDNMNKLLESLPSQLIGRVKEQDDYYKLRYEVPGLGKDDVKITVEDGVLSIKGEHNEEKGSEVSEDDDEYWSSKSYGYYNTSLMLPDDAKLDEIKAEMKDGVLNITIPRTEKPKKDVKEVVVQ